MEKYDSDHYSESQIDALIQEEMTYRKNNGDTCSSDENLCHQCRNIDRQNHYCWNCDSGSLYIPITFPLYNIVLMLSSLLSGHEDASKKYNSDHLLLIQQQGMINALKFAIQPFGTVETTFKYFAEEILSNEIDYCTPEEIENAIQKTKTNRQKETIEENTHRSKVGTINCHINACNHCKYRERVNSVFCWDCDRGTCFKNGVRSIDTIAKTLMYINTVMGEANTSRDRNENQTLTNIGFAEGLKWVIKPYTTEEALIDESGFEYITQEDFESPIRSEDEGYNSLDDL